MPTRVGVDHTEDGVFIENLGNNSIREASIAAYSEASWHVTEQLRLTGGLRADYYDFRVAANEGAGPDTVEGNAHDSQLRRNSHWPGPSPTTSSSTPTGAAASIPTMRAAW